MKLGTASLLTSLILLTAVIACADSSTFSADEARQALASVIGQNSEGRITVKSLTKTDGQKSELAGIRFYRLDFEAVIEFQVAGSWLKGMALDTRLSFEVSPAAGNGSWGGFQNQLQGGIPVSRGSVATIAGSAVGQQTENGWKIEIDQSRLVSGPAAPTAAAQPAASVVPADRPFRPRTEKYEGEWTGECVDNLRRIDSAKQQWALEERKGRGDVPSPSDLVRYLGHGTTAVMPACPAGGRYTFGAVGEEPVCSIHGSVSSHDAQQLADIAAAKAAYHKADVAICNDIAERAAHTLSTMVDFESHRHIKRIAKSLHPLSFTKMTSSGPETYRLVFEVEVEFLANGIWLNPQAAPNHASFDFAPFPLVSDTPPSGTEVHSGQVAKIRGMVMAKKTATGWRTSFRDFHVLSLVSPTHIVSEDSACINNLRLIDAAKQRWARATRKQLTDTPSWSDLKPYLGVLPKCPSDGTYMINAVGTKP